MARAIAFILILAQMAWSQSYSREDQYRWAYNSLGFIMYQAVADPVFIKSLNPEEAAVTKGVLMQGNYINTQNLFYKDKIEKLPASNGENVFAYVVSANRLQILRGADNPRTPLAFSDDRSQFDLKDGRPERTAITAITTSQPIYINLHLINQKDRPTTLGHAFSLIVHEVGRQVMGKLEIPPAVDSLAAKMMKFVDSRVVTQELNGVKVHSLNFPANGIESWIKQVYRLGDQDSSFPLWLFEQQGLYTFIENEHGFFDITSKMLDRYRNFEFVMFNPDPAYTWKAFNHFSQNWMRVTAKEKGRLEINYNLQQIQMILPFMNSKSPNPPGAYTYFALAPYGGGVQNFIFEIVDANTSNIKVGPIREDRIRVEDASYRVRLLKKDWDQDDLVLTYEIDGKDIFNFVEAGGFKMKLRPTLVFDLKGHVIEINGVESAEKSKQFEFRLKDIKTANDGILKVIGLELGAEKINIAQEGINTRVTAFLPSAEEFQLKGNSSKSSTELKSLQVWNGSEWVALNANLMKGIPAGSRMRLIFLGQEKLRYFEMLQMFQVSQNYKIYNTSDAGVRYEVAEITRQREGQKALIRYEDSQIRQTLQGSHLIVEFDVDQNLDTVHKFEGEVDVPIEVQAHLPKGARPISQVTTTASGLRFIDEVRFVTNSLESKYIRLKRPMPLVNKSVSPAQSDIFRKASKSSCRKLVAE